MSEQGITIEQIIEKEVDKRLKPVLERLEKLERQNELLRKDIKILRDGGNI